MFMKRVLITFSVGIGIIISAAIDTAARERARSAHQDHTQLTLGHSSGMSHRSATK